MAPSNGQEYHALDRLYAQQSEERQERRGLESRATASIAAALTAIAFSMNAVSSRLSMAGPCAIVLLGIGAAVLFAGVFLSTLVLLGGSAGRRGIRREQIRQEPPDIKDALDQAEKDANDLLEENNTRVVDVRNSSALISLGVFLLASGIVVLLAQHHPRA